MIVSEKMRGYHSRGSAIRQMFTEGLALKKRFGAENVADLSIGNPDFEPPDAFKRALKDLAADDPKHAYMPNTGYEHVRAAVARHLNSKGLLPDVESGHIVMTTGAAGALNIVLKTVLSPGDEVIVIKPYFVEYGYYIDNHDGSMVLVDSDPSCNLDPEAVLAAVTERTKAVILNSPNNPSGRLYKRAELERLAEGLEEASRKVGHPIVLISDEPYREILFEGGPFVSPASVYRNSILCYSWSKAFSVSGERIGYAAINPRMDAGDWSLLMGALAMSNRILGFVNAPAFMQQVIASCIDAVPRVDHYRAKRMRLLAALDRGGYRYVPAEGTFYLFPEAPGGEAEFVARAREKNLLVVPGTAFGRPGHFRISFAASEQTVDLACRILEELAA